MKLKTITISILFSMSIVGCGKQNDAPTKQTGSAASMTPSPKNLMGSPDVGMSEAQLLAAAAKKTSTHIIGNLIPKNGTAIPVRWVGVWQDDKASSEEAFAVSVGRVMRKMTSATGSEYCAQLCRKDDTWGAAIMTIDSGLYCPQTGLCPSNNWSSAGSGIHSHRKPGKYVPTPEDRALRNGTLAPFKEVAVESDRVSKEDRKLGGWVVGQRSLLKLGAPDRNGSTVKVVWDFERDVAGSAVPKPPIASPQVVKKEKI